MHSQRCIIYLLSKLQKYCIFAMMVLEQRWKISLTLKAQNSSHSPRLPQAQYSLTVLNRGLKHQSFQVNRSSDRSYIRCMIHNKIHPISLGCPRPNIALQMRDRSLKHHSFKRSHRTGRVAFNIKNIDSFQEKCNLRNWRRNRCPALCNVI